MNLELLGNNLLVKAVERETMTGGILLPEVLKSDKYDLRKVTVEGIGKDVQDLKVGFTVLLAPLKGKPYGDYIICTEDDIFAILED